MGRIGWQFFVLAFFLTGNIYADHNEALTNGNRGSQPEYSSTQVCGHYADTQSTCERIPFCQYSRGRAYCKKISGPNRPYACQIFASDPKACNENTFGNCEWDKGSPECKPTSSAFQGDSTLDLVCRHYDDTRSSCEKIPFCQYSKGRAYCQKISGSNRPYACQIFDGDPKACNENTFGNCEWNAGTPACKATRSSL
jgi:hypothetical protein